MKNSNIILASLISVLQFSTAHAALLWVSNNKNIITPNKAYRRMTGSAEKKLITKANGIMRHAHFKIKKTITTIGMYKMQSQHKLTADNTAEYHLKNANSIYAYRLITLASQLDNTFKQESTLLWIPGVSAVDTLYEVQFLAPYPRLNQIKSKLSYLDKKGLSAYTLTPDKKALSVDTVQIKAIKWITSQTHKIDIEKSFPNARLTEQSGAGLLVFKDATVQYVN